MKSEHLFQQCFNLLNGRANEKCEPIDNTLGICQVSKKIWFNRTHPSLCIAIPMLSSPPTSEVPLTEIYSFQYQRSSLVPKRKIFHPAESWSRDVPVTDFVATVIAIIALKTWSVLLWNISICLIKSRGGRIKKQNVQEARRFFHSWQFAFGNFERTANTCRIQG